MGLYDAPRVLTPWGWVLQRLCGRERLGGKAGGTSLHSCQLWGFGSFESHNRPVSVICPSVRKGQRYMTSCCCTGSPQLCMNRPPFGHSASYLPSGQYEVGSCKIKHITAHAADLALQTKLGEANRPRFPSSSARGLCCLCCPSSLALFSNMRLCMPLSVGLGGGLCQVFQAWSKSFPSHF